MFLLNNLKKFAFFAFILAVFHCTVSAAQAMKGDDDKKNLITSQKDNVFSHGYPKSLNQEASLTKEEEELDVSLEISSSTDNKEPKTPPQKTNPLLKSLSDPSHDKRSQKKTPILLKPSVQWIGHRDFTLIDENTTYNYKPSGSHFDLRQVVDDNVKHFPGSQNLFAFQLTFLVSSKNFGIESFRPISYPLRIEHQDKIKKLLFVSGSKSIESDDFSYIYSGYNINETIKNKWFQEVYGKTCVELQKSNSEQTYYHSEQWAMIYAFQQIEDMANHLYKNNQITKIHGVFLDGHTWNDPCELCQQMFHIKIPELKKKIHEFFKGKDILAPTFFVLPILSSQDWYKSKRLPPLDIQDSSLNCKKSNTKGTKNDKEKKTKKSETCNRFFQYTTDYKMRLENQDLQNSFNIHTNFVNKLSFPCFWFYKEGDVQESLKNKISRTFTTAWAGCYEIKKNKFSEPYLIFNHPTLKIWKNLLLYPFSNVTPELAQFTNLTSLIIKYQPLKDSGAEELSKALPHLTALTTLDLQENNFGFHDVKMSIVSIDTKEKKPLHKTDMNPRPGFPSLLKSLSLLSNLTYLNLSKNILNNGAAQTLSWTLSSLIHLGKLELQDTSLTYLGADNILTAAHNVPSITDVNFSANNIFYHCDNNELAEEAATLLLKKTLRIHVNNGKFAKPIILNLDDNTLGNIHF